MVPAVSSYMDEARETEKTTSQVDRVPPVSFPFLDLTGQFSIIEEEVMTAITRVMKTQNFILGEEVKQFEEEVAAYIGADFAVGCASGSDALYLALLALEIGPGDEVITTPFTFVATAGAITRVGATPVFADIDPAALNIDPVQIKLRITQKTKAIIPVHLFGLPADMDALSEIGHNHGLPIIEDAAQAIGAKYHGRPIGTIGSMGCLSFFPSKNLGGAGDGGMVTTNDVALAKRLRVLRVHGSDRKYHYQVLGTNSRLDALQASILRVKLKHLINWTKARQERAVRYRKLFEDLGVDAFVQLPMESATCVHVYNQFVVRCPERDHLKEYLRRCSIPTEIYYPAPLHLQPAFNYLEYKEGQLPGAETASREVLALPIYPELTAEQQLAVVRSIAAFYQLNSKGVR